MKTKIQNFVKVLLVIFLFAVFIFGFVAGENFLIKKNKTNLLDMKNTEICSVETTQSSYPTLIFTYLDSKIKISFIKQIREYTGLGLAQAKTIADAIVAGESQTVEANPKSDAAATTALTQFDAWVESGQLAYTKQGLETTDVEFPSNWRTLISSSLASLSDTSLIRSIVFSKDAVPTDAFQIGTNGLYFTFDENTGILVFYAIDSKLIIAPALSTNLFKNLSSLSSIDFTNFSTEKVTDMSYMFYQLYELTSLDLSNFDTSNVINMESMFTECSSLSKLDLSNFDTSNVTNMDCMLLFTAITDLNLSGFDTTKITSMSNALTFLTYFGGGTIPYNYTLNLSNWTLSNEATKKEVYDCITSHKFASLDLTGCDLSQLGDLVTADSKIDADSITINLEQISGVTIALANPLYYNGVEYDTIDSNMASAGSGTITLTKDSDVPSTGVIASTVLPAVISLVTLVGIAFIVQSLKNKRII